MPKQPKELKGMEKVQAIGNLMFAFEAAMTELCRVLPDEHPAIAKALAKALASRALALEPTYDKTKLILGSWQSLLSGKSAVAH